MLLKSNGVASIYQVSDDNGNVYLTGAVHGECQTDACARWLYEESLLALKKTGAHVVQERVFGRLSAAKQLMDVRDSVRTQYGFLEPTPHTYVQGTPTHGGELSGIIIRAVVCDRVHTLIWEDTPVGIRWEKDRVTHVVLQDIHGLGPNPDNNARTTQTTRMLRQANRILESIGGTYQDVVRTWFYLQHILDWYDDFNQARSEVYDGFGLMPKEGKTELLLPASTGIGVDNIHGSAGVMDLYAVIGNEDEALSITQLRNPGQKDAFKYGSAFSRGALIPSQSGGIMQLSGTASIDEKGVTIHLDDPAAQVACTFNKIQLLLSASDTGLAQFCGACVFVKNPAHETIFGKYAREKLPADLPLVVMVADVCRQDLLFEVDGELLLKGQT